MASAAPFVPTVGGVAWVVDDPKYSTWPVVVQKVGPITCTVKVLAATTIVIVVLKSKLATLATTLHTPIEFRATVTPRCTGHSVKLLSLCVREESPTRKSNWHSGTGWPTRCDPPNCTNYLPCGRKKRRWQSFTTTERCGKKKNTRPTVEDAIHYCGKAGRRRRTR